MVDTGRERHTQRTEGKGEVGVGTWIVALNNDKQHRWTDSKEKLGGSELSID